MPLDIAANCPLATQLADRLRAERTQLTQRWLDRIVARVDIDARRIFPTDDLLDHVPLLIDGIAAYVEDPVQELAADAPVVAKAMELGELRHRQRFDAHEIHKEYEILGGVLFGFLARTADELDGPCTRGELLICAHRLFRALAVIQQATTAQFLERRAEAVREREERLRTFNRAITHELKNHLNAIMGAGEVLALAGPCESEPGVEVIRRNARAMQERFDGLLELTLLEEDARQQRHVLLPQAVAEVVRQLRELAAARGVELRAPSAHLAPVEVPAAAVELALSNYISNAIKYSDPSKPSRWVEIAGSVQQTQSGGDGELVVRVRDNGLGVPAAARAGLFERFTRAHDDMVTGVEGTGLGLSLVRDTLTRLGGRAWAEFPGPDTVFAFGLPCRRAHDELDET
jgi:signal transduction histidine kinase